MHTNKPYRCLRRLSNLLREARHNMIFIILVPLSIPLFYGDLTLQRMPQEVQRQRVCIQQKIMGLFPII